MEIHLKELRVKWGGCSKSASVAATQGAGRWRWVVLGVLLLCGLGLYSKGLPHFGRADVEASPSEGGARLEGRVQWQAEYQGVPGTQAPRR
jgi:hypothetical protein